MLKFPLRRYFRRSQRGDSGLTLVEVVIALGVAAFFLTLVSTSMLSASNRIKDEVTAQQMLLMEKGVDQYIQANFSTIDADAAAQADNLYVIPTTTIFSAGVLPSGTSDTNAYDQSYQFVVDHIGPGEDEALVETVNGSTIPATNVCMVAAIVGAQAGCISSVNPTVIQGTYGGWSLPTATFGAYAPSVGHIVSVLYYNNGAVVTNYLDRYAVSGNTEPNTMHTNILMNGNSATGANDFTTQTGQELSKTPQDAEIVASGTTIPKPSCPTGETPQIFAAPSVVSTASGYPMSAMTAYAASSGSSWVVYLYVQTQSGWSLPPAPYAYLLVFTKCS